MLPGTRWVRAEGLFKSALVERTQAGDPGGALDGVLAQQFKLGLAVKTDAKALNGTDLSGDYVIAASSITRFNDDWKVTSDIRWYQMPNGVLDPNITASITIGNYVSAHRSLPPQTTAPEIDFITLVGDKKMKLSDLHGKVVALDFWATWCGPCQEPMAKLQTQKQILSVISLRRSGTPGDELPGS